MSVNPCRFENYLLAGQILLLIQLLPTLKGLRPIRLTYALYCLQEACHRRKFDGIILFPHISTLIHIPIFEKPVDELDRIANVHKDRIRG